MSSKGAVLNKCEVLLEAPGDSGSWATRAMVERGEKDAEEEER